MAAVVFAASLPLSAQSDPEAAMTALDSVVRKYSHYKNVLDPYVEKIYKKFDNNSEVITGIAKAYYSFSRPEGRMYYTFVTRDSANAYKYINLAIATKKSMQLFLDFLREEDAEQAGDNGGGAGE